MDSFNRTPSGSRNSSTGFRNRNRKPGGYGSHSGSSSHSGGYGSGSSSSSGGYRGSRGSGRFGFNNRPRGGNRFARGGSSIDISQFISKAKAQNLAAVEEAPFVATHTFADFDFVPGLNKNIEYKQYATPTPIQDQAIPHIMAGKDFVGLAHTGTGKTAAFLLPLINKVARDKSQRVLIIVPVRELADQIEQEFRSFSKFMNQYSTLCIGGASIGRQINDLRRNPQFVIGTPGRLKDLHQRKILNLESFHTIVLDEVDRMFDMGFSEDIKYLLSFLPKERQSLFFSATMPPEIQKLADVFLKDPVKISVKTGGETAKNVEQDVIRIEPYKKFEKLVELLKSPGFEKVLIFTRTKRGAEDLMRMLSTREITSESIHGDKPQSKRLAALRLFKENRVNVLIATDVAARGLDIQNVSHVINYDKPGSYDDYVHRIGRTGRGEKKGIALTFI